MVQGF